MIGAFKIAGQQLGLNEHDQKAALQDFLATGGQNLDPATTAWCAAFVNATLSQAGMQGTGALNARSYLDWGDPVSDPMQGDIAVFSRGDPSGWQGHVGFFDGYNPDGTIRVLGGNQGDAVSIASYDPGSLLGFRRAPGEANQRPQEMQTFGQPDPAVTENRNALARPQPPQVGSFLDPAAFESQPMNALASVPQYRISPLSRRA